MSEWVRTLISTLRSRTSPQNVAGGHEDYPGDDLKETPALVTAVNDMVERAKSAWPELGLPAETFIRHAAERLPAGASAQSIEAVQAADLYLACACAHGIAGAADAFERTVMPKISAHLRRLVHRNAGADDVEQQFRVRILVGEGGHPARVGLYDGSVPLIAWLRVIAARMAIDLRRSDRARADVQGADRMLDAPLADPELELLKRRYTPEFESALKETLSALAPREKNILGFYFFEGMSAEAIGRLHRVSSRTVQRWIAELRERLLGETRRALAGRLDISASHLDTLLGLVRSRLDLSLQDFFRKGRR